MVNLFSNSFMVNIIHVGINDSVISTNFYMKITQRWCGWRGAMTISDPPCSPDKHFIWYWVMVCIPTYEIYNKVNYNINNINKFCFYFFFKKIMGTHEFIINNKCLRTYADSSIFTTKVIYFQYTSKTKLRLSGVAGRPLSVRLR